MSKIQRFFLSADHGSRQYFPVFHGPSSLKLFRRTCYVVLIEIEDYMILTGTSSPINFYRAVFNSTLKDFTSLLWDWAFPCNLIFSSLKLENGQKKHVRNVARIKYGFVELVVILFLLIQGHRSVLKWGYPNSFRLTTLNNQLNQISMRRIQFKLTMKTPAWPRISLLCNVVYILPI